jgi:hypothetical protein
MALKPFDSQGAITIPHFTFQKVHALKESRQASFPRRGSATSDPS